MGFEVEVRNVDGAVTALGAAGPHTLVVDKVRLEHAVVRSRDKTAPES